MSNKKPNTDKIPLRAKALLKGAILHEAVKIMKIVEQKKKQNKE
jgi:hypothetical protein